LTFVKSNFHFFSLSKFFFLSAISSQIKIQQKRQLGENCDPHGVTNEKKKKLEKVEHFCSKLFFVEGKKVLHVQNVRNTSLTSGIELSQ
jgi:hypothetical protein